MLICAYKQVLNKKDSINSINLFPVPDQDTGDNLTATLKGVFDAINGNSFISMQELRDAAIDGSICNASGNVGIIITGFLNGFLSNLSENEISILNFSQALNYGFTSAHDSIQDPKEGTILDVIKATADSFSKDQQKDIKKRIKSVLKSAQKALEDTQNKMDIYQKAKTVDAGGYGFILILQGFLDSFNKKPSKYHLHETIALKNTNFFQVINYRYEVISLLKLATVNKQYITNKLNSFGDCLDIVEANQKIKIHIHTDLPDEVAEIISTLGTVIYINTTDMTQQIEQNENAKETIGIVIDDASGLDLDFATKNDIALVPFKYSWKGVDELPSAKNLSIYQKMEKFKNKTNQYGKPKTSQPSIQAFLGAFKEQLQKYNRIFCITISSSVSGSYNCAIQARSLLPISNQEKIIIPDFKQIGPGESILAMEIVNLIKQGFTFKQIQTRIATINSNIDVFGGVKDTFWIISGGRVSGKKAKISAFLQKINFKLIFGESSKNIGLRKIFLSNKPLPSLLIRYIHKKFPANKLPQKIIIQHGNNKSEMEKFKNQIDPDNYQIIQSSSLNLAIGSHTGPGTLVVGILKNK